MVGLHLWLPVGHIIVAPYTYVGVMFILTGLGINIWASRRFTQVQTTIKPFETSSHLVIAGVYKVSRNPMYFGMVLMLFGLFILLGSLSPLLIIPLFMGWITIRFIRREEQDLEARFGEAYLAYKTRVRRWI